MFQFYILVELNHLNVSPHSVSWRVRSLHYLTDFSGNIVPLGTEVRSETEVADTVIVISTLPGPRQICPSLHASIFYFFYFYQFHIS